MAGSNTETNNIEIAKRYFRCLDAGDPGLFDLFSDDAEFYFPKYGLGVGKGALSEIAAERGKVVASSEHAIDGYRFISTGDLVIVEGTTRGQLKTGERWAAGETPAGRFCNVFEVKDGLITSLHVYLDPDFASTHEEAFLWGREGRRW